MSEIKKVQYKAVKGIKNTIGLIQKGKTTIGEDVFKIVSNATENDDINTDSNKDYVTIGATASCIDSYDICSLYGGNQGYLMNNSDYYSLDNPDVKKIVSKYFKDGTYTNDDLKALYKKIGYTGCGFMASANAVFDVTKNMSDEEFKEKFGFDKYINYKVGDKTVRMCNFPLMLLDYYLFCQKSGNDNTMQDINGNIEKLTEDGNLSDDESLELTGGKEYDPYTNPKSFRAYMSTKGINLKDCNAIYTCHCGVRNVGHLFKLLVDGFSPIDGYSYTKKVKQALNEGKDVVISMDDFTLYSAYDEDGNGKLDDVVSEHVGGHAMLVTGITENNEYIVSSWGNKYLVKPKYANVYNMVSNLFTDSDNELGTVDILG